MMDAYIAWLLAIVGRRARVRVIGKQLVEADRRENAAIACYVMARAGGQVPRDDL
jgi:hypothetical protein